MCPRPHSLATYPPVVSDRPTRPRRPWEQQRHQRCLRPRDERTDSKGREVDASRGDDATRRPRRSAGEPTQTSLGASTSPTTAPARLHPPRHLAATTTHAATASASVPSMVPPMSALAPAPITGAHACTSIRTSIRTSTRTSTRTHRRAAVLNTPLRSLLIAAHTARSRFRARIYHHPHMPAHL